MESPPVAEYKKLMVTLLNAFIQEQLNDLIRMLEQLPDDTADLIADFENRQVERTTPVHWIAILRFLRFSLVLKSRLGSSYDDFVAAYQSLNMIKNPDADHHRLIQELGNYLYRVDEIFGDLDRLVARLLTEINQGLVSIYGIQPDPGALFYRGKMSEEVGTIIQPLLKALLRQCYDMLEQLRIMQALWRMKKLLLG